MKISLLFGALLMASTALGATPSQGERAYLFSGGWKFSSALPAKRFESLIQKAVTKLHGKAFQYLGVDEDFFHGHMLYEAVGTGEGREYFPRAILYHTQEEAHKAHWEGTIDRKYDYVSVTKRNWIQWLNDDPKLDGTDIRNAREYLDQTTPLKPADVLKKNRIQFFDETLAPKVEWHYTIHSRNLDPAKLGFDLGGELQFTFYDQPCGTVPSEEYYAPKGPITIDLPDGQEICLGLSTAGSAFIDLPWK